MPDVQNSADNRIPFHAYVTEVLTLFDEEGNEHPFRILGRLSHDGKRYLALGRMDRGIGQTLVHFLEELPEGEYGTVFQKEQYDALYHQFRAQLDAAFDLDDDS